MITDILNRYWTPWNMRILDPFLKEHASGIETELSEVGAVLLMTRIVSWLKVTYRFGYAVKELLRSIMVFLDCGRRYVAKFIAVDGVSLLRTHPCCHPSYASRARYLVSSTASLSHHQAKKDYRIMR